MVIFIFLLFVRGALGSRHLLLSSTGDGSAPHSSWTIPLWSHPALRWKTAPKCCSLPLPKAPEVLAGRISKGSLARKALLELPLSAWQCLGAPQGHSPAPSAHGTGGCSAPTAKIPHFLSPKDTNTCAVRTQRCFPEQRMHICWLFVAKDK